ncbi:hypothetical protein H4R33_007112, partial [Dimargaris cristalligena]
RYADSWKWLPAFSLLTSSDELMSSGPTFHHPSLNSASRIPNSTSSRDRPLLGSWTTSQNHWSSGCELPNWNHTGKRNQGSRTWARTLSWNRPNGDTRGCAKDLRHWLSQLAVSRMDTSALSSTWSISSTCSSSMPTCMLLPLRS